MPENIDAQINELLDRGRGGVRRPALNATKMQLSSLRIDEDRTETGAVSEEFVRSVKNLGVLLPILVDPNTCVIIDGRRRYKAAKAAGLVEVPVVCIDHADAGMVGITCNLHRSEMTALERARKYREIMSRLAMTARQLATALGITPSSVSNDLALLDAPADVQRAIEDGTGNVHAARAAGRVARRKKTKKTKKKRCAPMRGAGRRRTQIVVDTHLPDEIQSLVVKEGDLTVTLSVPRDRRWTGPNITACLHAVASKVARLAEEARHELDRE